MFVNMYVLAHTSSCVCMCVCVGIQEYLTDLQALLRSVSETDFKLNSPEYWPAAYYNLPQQEHCLKVSTASVFLSEDQRKHFSGNNIRNSVIYRGVFLETNVGLL